MQESLLALLCYDDTPGGARTVSGLVAAEVYDPYFRELAKAAKAYIAKYEKPPGEHTLDLIEQLKAQYPKEEEIYDRLYESLEITRGSINRPYVIDQASQFIRHQALRRGLTSVVELIQKGGVEQMPAAEAELSRLVRGAAELRHDGIVLSDISKSLHFLSADREPAFPTGIPELDRYELGPARGCLHLFAAEYGMGKSWWLVHLARQALMIGKRVLYISLEMDEDSLCQRLIQNLFSISKRPDPIVRQVIERDEHGNFVDFRPQRVKRRPSLASKNIRKRIVRRLDAFRRGRNMVVKSFPSGSLTIEALEGYMDTLEGASGFMPDLLLIDYPGLMKLDVNNLRVSSGRNYVELRGIARKRNIAVAGVSQVNRAGLGAAKNTGKALAEDISQAHTADVLFIASQTETEHNLGLMRVYVDKARGDVSKFTVLLSQAFAMGQFVLDSVGQLRGYTERLKDFGEDEDE